MCQIFCEKLSKFHVLLLVKAFCTIYIEVNAMKVGMLERREIIETVATFLRGFQNARNIVIDPVMFSKTGHLILAEDAVEALK
ncbi:MAG TPA: hypothetical protein DCP55_05945 [Chitinophagaceae bacterium]|nr:hypothetical protein [Chitinophagaceae bacterium]